MGERVEMRMTVEEFFAWQEGQDCNYELVDGIPVLPVKSMTGATERHDTVAANAKGALDAQLREKRYYSCAEGASVHIVDRPVRRPSRMPATAEADVPQVVVEVLSPSTSNYDRFSKIYGYRRAAAISVVLIVDTERPRVTVWRRGDAAWHDREFSGLDAVIELPEIDADLPFADLYEGLPFDDGEIGR